MEVVDDQDTSRLTYSGQWIASDASGADGGTIHSSSDSAAVVTLRFSGTSVQVDALRSPNGANFTVRLDNSLYGPYSLYGANATVSNVWSQDRLDPSVTHTIEIRKAQGASEALAINVDRFRIASVPSSTISSSTSSQGTSTTSSSSTRNSSTSSLISQCPNTTTLSFLPSTIPSSSFFSPTSSSPAMSSFPSTTSLDVPDETPGVDSGQVDSVPDNSTQDGPIQDDPTQDDPIQDDPPTVSDEPPDNANEPDDSLIATTSSTRSSSTTSNSTFSHTTTSHSTSTSTPLAPLTLTLPSQGTSVPVTSSTSDSDLPAQSKTGVILGSIVAVVIAISLLTILVVWIRRRRAKAMEDDLRPSTTPAYQTTTAGKRILSPLGIYRHRMSPSSSGGRYVFGRGNSGLYTETREYGFGSNSNQGNLGPSPVAHTQSSHSPPVGGASAEGGPLSSVEESAQYMFYPSANAAQDSHTPRYAESVSSDYPYTLAFHPATPGVRQ
ncbi:hypothetical protein FRC19_008695 [Serendipita sp. 401]|nr:hypothetical protein FRC19_008695 [Serendipita sp. 401]